MRPSFTQLFSLYDAQLWYQPERSPGHSTNPHSTNPPSGHSCWKLCLVGLWDWTVARKLVVLCVLALAWGHFVAAATEHTPLTDFSIWSSGLLGNWIGSLAQIVNYTRGMWRCLFCLYGERNIWGVILGENSFQTLNLRHNRQTFLNVCSLYAAFKLHLLLSLVWCLCYKRRAGTQHLSYGFYGGPGMSGQKPASTNSTVNRLNELCNVCSNHMLVMASDSPFLILKLLSVVIRRSNIILLEGVIFHDKKP